MVTYARMIVAVGLTGVLAFAAAGPACAEYSAEEQANLKLVQTVIASFQAGDLDACLACFSDDIDWDTNGSEEFVPSHAPIHGKADLRKWFEQMGTDFQTTEFGADQYFADGGTVVILGHETSTYLANGVEYSQDWCAVFTCAEGLITDALLFDDSALEHWVENQGK